MLIKKASQTKEELKKKKQITEKIKISQVKLQLKILIELRYTIFHYSIF